MGCVGEALGRMVLHPCADPSRIPQTDDGIPPWALLLMYWAGQMWENIFQSIDKDGDHKISPEEIRALDKNGDQGVDREELVAALAERGFKTYPGEFSFADAVLAAAGDVDKDGVLTLNEINSMRL